MRILAKIGPGIARRAAFVLMAPLAAVLGTAAARADLVEGFNVAATVTIDVQNASETPQRTQAPPQGTGFRWGGYAYPPGTSTGKVQLVPGQGFLHFSSLVKKAGSYAYTIFADDGTSQGATAIDLSSDRAAIAVDSPTTVTAGSLRFLIRTGPGAWFVSQTPLTLSGAGPLTQSLSGMTWLTVAASGGGATLDALVGGDEGPLTFGGAGLPNLSAVDGGGVVIASDVNTPDTAYYRIDSVRWIEGGVNHSPAVDVGADRETLVWSELPLAAAIDDDGPIESLTKTWMKAGGPGAVTFGDPAAAATTASFSLPGAYLLRLTVDDGESSATDELAATVHPAGPWPLETGFETPEYAAGDLSFQNGWLGVDSARVQGETVHSGLQAVGLTTRSLAAYGVVGNTSSTIWIEVSCKGPVEDVGQEMPSAAGRLPATPGQSCALLFDPAKGITCLDGDGEGYGVWRSTGILAEPWTRLKIRQDYARHRWDLYVDNALVLSGLGNAWNTSNVTRLEWESGDSGPLHFDDIRTKAFDNLPPASISLWTLY